MHISGLSAHKILWLLRNNAHHQDSICIAQQLELAEMGFELHGTDHVLCHYLDRFFMARIRDPVNGQWGHEQMFKGQDRNHGCWVKSSKRPKIWTDECWGNVWMLSLR